MANYLGDELRAKSQNNIRCPVVQANGTAMATK